VNGWWRRNRIWLLVLPVALALALAAASYRVVNIYLEKPYLDRVAEAAPGDSVAVEYDIGDGGTRRFRVELEAIGEVRRVPDLTGEPQAVPEGAVAYAVQLAFEAPRESDLDGCEVVLVDEAGRRYGDEVNDPMGQFDLCARTDDPEAEPESLPEQWEVAPVVLAAPGAAISEVWLSFPGRGPEPEYVALRVR
jgi:hypothetical protein